VTSTTDLGRIKGSDWELINEHAERLEKAWREGSKAVDLGQYLPPPGAALRLAVLHELIKTDLEMRWRANRPGVLEDYLERFPELGDPPSLPPSLVYEEYRARSLFGDHPSLDLYRQRFPAQIERVEQILKTYPLPVREPKASPVPASHDTAASGPVPTMPPSLHPGAPTPVTPPLPAGDHILPSEGYVLGEEIGHGEFGTVCRAVAPGGVEVAVKRIHRPLSDKLSQRELKALELIRQLRHPFLIQTHNYWPSKDRLVIVMELADGSLTDWLNQVRASGQSGIAAADLVPYFLEAAEALDFLHAHNVMHRDVKPGNLLRLGGHAKVADFGLVRLQEDRLEQATIFGGTALYLPPEGWRNQVSRHSDQYSLALTYAEVRLGRRVVTGKSLPDIMMEHINGAPDLNGLPAAEQQVVLKAASKDPEARYPSCVAFVRALAEATRPAGRTGTSRSTGRRKVLTLAILVLAGLLGASLGVHFFRPSAVLPQGFRKDNDPSTKVVTIAGKGRYTHIVFPFAGADPLVFLLMSPTREPNLPAFYISKDKVTRGQFMALLQDPRMEDLLRSFEHKAEGQGLMLVRRNWRHVAWTDDRPQLPMTNVTPTEAHCFAACLGGKLPTAAQWDKAGGRFEDPPAKAPCDVDNWTQRKEWEPVGSSPADTSILGCTDMSGNGREWVRSIVSEGNDRTVPMETPTPEDNVMRRGNAPQSPKPFYFNAIRSHPLDRPYDSSEEDTGFRVVVEVPE
jgi:serine/threonine protein kinase